MPIALIRRLNTVESGYFSSLNNAFTNEMAMRTITNEKGNAPIIITDRSASIPPADNSTPINIANITPQITTCLVCF